MAKHLAFLTKCSLVALASCIGLTTPAYSEYKIGIVAPLSGIAAEAGKEIVEGATLAEETINAHGIKIKLFAEDGCLPVPTRTALLNLFDMRKVHGIAASYCVIGLYNNIDIINKRKIPTIHTSVLPDTTFSAEGFVHSITGRISADAKLGAQYLFKEKGMTSATILYIDSPWSDGYIKSFIAEAEALGITKLEKIQLAFDQDDFRSIVPKLLEQKPESLYILHFSGNGGTLVKQLRQGGYKGLMVGPHEIESNAFTAAAGESANGLIFFSPAPAQESSEALSFGDNFTKRYGRSPQNIARWSYDSVTLMAAALERCSGDQLCTKNKLRATKDYGGVSGIFSFDAAGAAIRPYVRKEYQNLVAKVQP